MNGVYQQYGDMRQHALVLAIESAEDFSTPAIMERAEQYFRFLASGAPDTNS